MCGIIGYNGTKNASEIVIKGLKKLEYRGYDSWGIAIKKGKSINLIKEVGRIGAFSEEKKLPKSSIAIGHSRWATHGGVTKENSHPHTDCKKKIMVVHNGIIENYQKLKEDLTKKGHKFASETDTEVIPHLIEENTKKGLSFIAATKNALQELNGRYAVLVINKDTEDIIAAKNGSPLVIGVGKDEFFVASDIPAFLEETNKAIFLEDNDLAIISKKEIKFWNLKSQKEIEKQVHTIEWNIEQAKKGNYPHFMLKEIFEQKEVLKRIISNDDRRIEKISRMINEGFGTFFVACGTAYHASLIGSYIFSEVAKKHINVVLASEFPNYEKFITNNSLVIAISQSGETADVLEAVKIAKKKNAKVVGMINNVGSSLAREVDETIMIKAGPEIAVASTKAFTAQVATLILLAHGCVDKLKDGKTALEKAHGCIEELLNEALVEKIKLLCQKLKNQKSLFAIGRSVNYPLALESALKIKEVSYIHAEGFAGGELKHGPIALIEKGTPCIVYLSNDQNKEDSLSNAIEIKSRGGYIIGIGPEDNKAFDFFIKIKDCGLASPLVNTIPAQLIAYYLSSTMGYNPDRPRNLAKSVTVK